MTAFTTSDTLIHKDWYIYTIWHTFRAESNADRTVGAIPSFIFYLYPSIVELFLVGSTLLRLPSSATFDQAPTKPHSI